jgi:DNA-binding transcriptional LysR family regulator
MRIRPPPSKSRLTTLAVGSAYAVTLQQLTYFLAAAEHGSFTAAADVLRLARPSLSEQIAHLEAELGVALFVRTGRRLELTDAGRLLRPEAERTLAAASDAAEAVRRARTLIGGTASLGTFSTAHHLLLPGLVEDFARRHPEVAIRVVSENSSQLADAVRAGRLEAGLIALPIDDEGLEVGAPVVQLEVVYGSAEHDGHGSPMAIEQLAQATLVLPEARWGDEDPTRRQLAERAQRAGVTIRPRIEVQHANAALELAARGLGGTLVTRALLDALGYGDRLAAVPLDPPLQETFAFIQRRNFRLSPATRALMTLAEDRLAKLARQPSEEP